MTFVVKSKEKYLTFERFVRDMDILTTVEETSYIHLATPFRDEADAKEFIKIAESSGYDTTDYTIIDKDKKLADDKATEENAKLETKRKQWNKLSTDDKRAYLSRLKSEEEVKKFLVDIQETSSLTPMTKEELAMRKVKHIEEQLGITFTEDQMKILLEKEMKQ